MALEIASRRLMYALVPIFTVYIICLGMRAQREITKEKIVERKRPTEKFLNSELTYICPTYDVPSVF